MDRRDDLIKLQQLIIEEQLKTIAELQAIIAEQAKTIEQLNNRIALLEERLAERERSLNLDSTNSGKPPSSDGLKKALRVQSLREKSGKKPGGQPGHEGSTLRQVDDPDLIERIEAKDCPSCKTDLTSIPVASIRRRQVFEIPVPVKPVVTEYHVEVKHCPGCNKQVEANKKGLQLSAPVQYGPLTKTVAAYLNAQHLLPLERVAQVMQELFKMSISEATIENMVKSCAQNTKTVVEKIEDKLKLAPVKGADESSLRLNGKTHWLHTLCNHEFVHYRMSLKRGDIPNVLAGTILIHDHFVSYYARLSDVLHAVCNAHHLRELKAVTEIDKEPWARDMARLLCFGNNFSQRKREDISVEWLARFRKVYDKIIAAGLAFHEKLGGLKKSGRGRIKRRPGHNLLLRLKNRADDVLRFLHDENVPFTNNQSEQALRMIKVKQKISGCFRTTSGAESFLTVRSYTATAQKQGHNTFEALVAAAQRAPINFALA